MRRLTLWVAAACVVGCSVQHSEPAAQERRAERQAPLSAATGTPVPVRVQRVQAGVSEDATLDTLARVIREKQLTTLRPECYSFERSDSI